jgi:epsilon-lactone hydrolase
MSLLARARFAGLVAGVAGRTALRRSVHGPLHPGWPWQTELVAAVLQASGEKVARMAPVAARRAMEARAVPPERLEGVRVREAVVGGVSGEWVTPASETSGATVLYLHGGGYALGSPASHRHFAAQLALRSKAACFVPDYRLAPEHPCPAAIDDAVAVYDALLDQGASPERLCIGGDSAGGGLTLATLLALRDGGAPLPAAAVLISPWVDLTCMGGSLEDNARYDYLNPRSVRHYASWYAGELSLDDPRVSPLQADLRGLPPLFVCVGDAEVLRDENLMLVERAREAKVNVEVEIGEGMIHVYPLLAPLLPQGRSATKRIAQFIRKYQTEGPTVRAANPRDART